MQTGKAQAAAERPGTHADGKRGEISGSLRGCTCFRLRRLTRRVTAVYNRALAATGMRVTQYSLLSNLRHSGPLPLSVLAESLDMDRTTLSRNLKPLTDAGWVAVGASPDDARVRLVALTRQGEAHLQSARTHWKRAQEEVNATIGAGELGALHELLDRYVTLFRPAAGGEGDIV
jgi:DNA-binding MarR family transcriptional regulator